MKLFPLPLILEHVMEPFKSKYVLMSHERTKTFNFHVQRLKDDNMRTQIRKGLRCEIVKLKNHILNYAKILLY
jgi:hypothetical protein